jgi:hypothetical protein
MQEKARNFVLIYSGRTGSSPIVNILARQPGLCVPVFEDLDHRFIGAERAARIPEILDAVFRTGALAGAALPEHLPRFPAGETPRSIGFKWRPYGDWEKVCAVFRRHDVVLFVLGRRDFVELAASLYITSHGNKLQDEVAIPQHPQFGLAIAARAEVERGAIERLQHMRFPVRPRLLYRVMRQQANAGADLLALARDAARRGVPVRALAYEDFVADNAGFIRAMLGEIGWTAAAVDTTSAFEKVMKVPAKTRLEGLGRWLWLPPLRYQMLRYWRTRRALEGLAAASLAGRKVRGRPGQRPVRIRG